MPACSLHFLGCDRSDDHLDLTLLEPDGTRTDQRILARAAPVHAWLGRWRQLHAHDQLAICFEQPASNLISLFAPFEFIRLYPINPATLCSYRQAFVTSGAKDDPDDGFWLAELVRTHHQKLTVWKPQSKRMRTLQALVEARRGAANHLTALSNQIVSLLKSYFPEALELIGENKTSPLAVAFLRRWPTLPQLKRSRWPAIEAFYRHHCCGRQSTLKVRREIIRQARPITLDEAVIEPALLRLRMLLDQVEALRATLVRYERVITEIFNAHPDHLIVASLPGAAKVYAPRLLAALGEQRDRFADAASLQRFSGIAPVLIRSGRSCWVKRRHACPKFIRQSFHEWAGESIRHSRWARAYYQTQRDRGKKHHTATRSLAFKWQRIIWKCWTEHTPYDETTYMHSLQIHNPTLYQLALKTTLPGKSKN